jgi:hypothetical protein
LHNPYLLPALREIEHLSGCQLRDGRPWLQSKGLTTAISELRILCPLLHESLRNPKLAVGFRNRNLRAIFFPQTTDDKQQTRRHSAWISRKLRLLRAHALITKIVGTHRYQLTSTGRKIIVAILSALRSTVAQLTPVTAQLTAVAA